MTDKWFLDYYRGQVKFYKGEIEFDNDMIQFCNSMLKYSRKDDKELVEYVWNKGVVNEMEMRYFKPGFESHETKKQIAERRRYYYRRRKDQQELEKYERLAKQYEAKTNIA